MLGEVVLRYLEDMGDPFVNRVKEMIRETVGSNCQCSDNSVATLRTLCQEVGCSYHALAGFTQREVSPTGPFLASSGWSCWKAKMGADSAE